MPGITALYTGSTKHVDSRHDADEPGHDESMIMPRETDTQAGQGERIAKTIARARAGR